MNGWYKFCVLDVHIYVPVLQLNWLLKIGFPCILVAVHPWKFIRWVREGQSTVAGRCDPRSKALEFIF